MNSNILIGIPIKSLENPMSRLSKSISLVERKELQLNLIKNTVNSFKNKFVQIYLIYFGLGSIKFVRESFLWIALKEPFWCGVLALTINTVAYGAEIFRGGSQSIEKSQVESGLSLGFGKFLLLILLRAIVLKTAFCVSIIISYFSSG